LRFPASKLENGFLMPDSLKKPVLILSAPQLGENIGAAARAMANFGLTDLRLVAPRDGWPNPKADAMAAGAADIIQAARVFDTAEAALADLHFVLATTARDRAQAKLVLTPVEATRQLRETASFGHTTGILFGSERSGLTNDEVALADAVVTIPTDPGFSSLNLGQAALLLAYEWFKAGDATPPERIDHGVAQPAPREDLFRLFVHLEEELEKAGFLYPPGNRAGMIRTLRAILHRAKLTDQEVRTLRGVIVALTKGKSRRKPPLETLPVEGNAP
jgi:tRNA/rRNA methyltransferase